jgi:hypothetical protein
MSVETKPNSANVEPVGSQPQAAPAPTSKIAMTEPGYHDGEQSLRMLISAKPGYDGYERVWAGVANRLLFADEGQQQLRSRASELLRSASLLLGLDPPANVAEAARNRMRAKAGAFNFGPLVAELGVLGPETYRFHGSYAEAGKVAICYQSSRTEHQHMPALRPQVFHFRRAAPNAGEERKKEDDRTQQGQLDFALALTLLVLLVEHGSPGTKLDLGRARAIHVDVPFTLQQLPSPGEHAYEVQIGGHSRALPDITVDHSIPVLRLRMEYRTRERPHPKMKNVMVSSPWFMQALEEVMHAVRYSDPKSLLLLAPPGSGKEVLAECFCWALDQPCVQFSIAGLQTSADIAAELERLPTGSIGTVHVDEIDKAEPAALASLLRIMETRTFRCRDGERRYNRMAWLFTGSVPWTLLRNRQPADFWTRVVRRVQMQHPLERDPDDRHERWAADYFSTFWALKCREGKNGEEPSGGDKKEWYSSLEEGKHVRKVVADSGALLAEQFSRALRTLDAFDIGIRNIRNAVDLMWSKLRERAMKTSPLTRDAADLIKSDDVFGELLRVIAQVHY